MPGGPEGPMIHAGAIVAVAISKVFIITLK